MLAFYGQTVNKNQEKPTMISIKKVLTGCSQSVTVVLYIHKYICLSYVPTTTSSVPTNTCCMPTDTKVYPGTHTVYLQIQHVLDVWLKNGLHI